MDELNDQPARHVWGEAQMRKALTDLVKAATNRKSDFVMSVPARPDDTDCLLGAVIDEVLEWRAGRERLEAVEQVLARMVHYYDGQVQSSQKLADLLNNPSVQMHHSIDAYRWLTKAETVRQVAKNLEIEIPAEEAAAPVSGSKPLSGFHQHIYLDGLQLFQKSEAKLKEVWPGALVETAPTETENTDGQP